MPNRSEVDRYRRAQAALVRSAKSDLARIWNDLDTGDLVAARNVLEDVWPSLVEAYGSAAAEVAAEWMDDLVGDAILSGATDSARANARMRWGLTSAFNGDTAQSLSTLGVVLDELVQQHGRDTVDSTCRDLGVSYARVPSGDTCDWCLILASRGPVYGSESSAGGIGNRYHGDCDCVPTPIRDPDDLPEGYDPDDLDAQYVKAREKAGSGSIKKITAAMRELRAS